MLTGPQNIAESLAAVRARIAAAEAAAGRAPGSVRLLGVAKGQPATAVRTAAAAGLEDVGENYLQEALPRLEALADLRVAWHFIGQLQANKTRPVAERFDWVHTVDRLRIAERLSAQRPYHAPALNVCVQVNLGGEATKGGVAPAELAALCRAVAALPRLRLRGLMCIPPAETDPGAQRRWFARLRALAATVAGELPGLDTLSMGMSDDLEAAIAEGATIVRIGTALFGPRPAAG
jgi:pyridoxal phosphate enzyme (YggS family)